jgi:hypothetical protein
MTNGVCENEASVEELPAVMGGPESAPASPKKACGMTIVLISVRVKLYRRKTELNMMLCMQLVNSVREWMEKGDPLPMARKRRWLLAFLRHVANSLEFVISAFRTAADMKQLVSYAYQELMGYGNCRVLYTNAQMNGINSGFRAFQVPASPLR